MQPAAEYSIVCIMCICAASCAAFQFSVAVWTSHGLWCRVPTLTGTKELSIRPGTQPGDRLRMRGLGLPQLGGYSKGDQFVHINVTLPRSTTQRQREVLIEFQTESKQKAA